jgi:transposase
MADETLFPIGEKSGAQGPAPAPGRGKLRLQLPVRDQVEIHYENLDALIALDHPVRLIWDFVAGSDLSILTDAIRSTEDSPGRPAIDPRILLGLWLYATIDGIGSARALEKLCGEHVVYRWMCGGVPVNYHTLADFRANLGECLDDLLTTMVATLISKNLVTLNRVAHDGVRIRAHAGTGSFRRRDRLGEFLEQAQAQVDALKSELQDEPGASDKRRKAAVARAARERLEKVQAALSQHPDIKKKKKNNKEQARASTTDADARKMRMADGGFRPGYNAQITTDPMAQVIVEISVTQSGSDEGQLLPAIEAVRKRYGKQVSEGLADAGFSKKQDIEELGAAGCSVYAPIPKHKAAEKKRIRKERADGPHVAAWRKRMESEEAKGIYQLRARTECVHAQLRNRGLYQVPLRGRKKVRAVLLLHAVSHNIMRRSGLMKQKKAS